MRSSRQQNEQALRVSDRTDRINAKLTIVLNTWFTLRIIVLPKHLWEGIRTRATLFVECPVLSQVGLGASEVRRFRAI